MPQFGDKKRIFIDIDVKSDGDCRFALWLNDNIHWGRIKDNKVRRVRWSCINFLYELGANWVYLFCREYSSICIDCWFDGLELQELMAFRQGNLVLFTSGEEVCSLTIADAMELWGMVGDYISAALARTAYTAYALDAWAARSVDG